MQSRRCLRRWNPRLRSAGLCLSRRAEVAQLLTFFYAYLSVADHSEKDPKTFRVEAATPGASQCPGISRCPGRLTVICHCHSANNVLKILRYPQASSSSDAYQCIYRSSSHLLDRPIGPQPAKCLFNYKHLVLDLPARCLC